MTSSLFQANGDYYDQLEVFDDQYRLNETALMEYGLPHLSVAEPWSFMATAVSSASP